MAGRVRRHPAVTGAGWLGRTAGAATDLTEYRRRYADSDAAPGWEAVAAALAAVHPGQEPRHWGTLIKYALGGPDPLDGVSAYGYRAGGVGHLHLCTYGFSDLYFDEGAFGGEESGFGFEVTFRVASALPPAGDSNWALSLSNNLSRYVFDSGRGFAPYHWLGADGPLRAGHPTGLVGLAFVPAPALPPAPTPHGRVESLRLFGRTGADLAAVKDGSRTCEEVVNAHRAGNPLLVPIRTGRPGPRGASEWPPRPA